ncbi:hypothetical protein [Nostoc sp. TCL26-01]|uniref:hypothetical protein n=1 Tax=Nostoc sp. TCL26-01 TaxID=2576904 RepID=UPI002118C75D|nr:hypothetical protein [Nostoc sp. TCL26-01]QLE56350.1 hypothetical protein FD725_12870 [Nostoc sp. TCL26-01]
MSQVEKEKIFHTQLVKYGVKYEQAARVAKIIASGKSEELLTPEEKQLVKEACQQWLTGHRRFRQISSLNKSIQG